MHEPPLHHAHVRVLIYDYCEKTLKFVVNPGTLNMVTYFCRLLCVRAALHYIHLAVSDSPTSAWACLGLVSPHRPLPALWLRACSL